MRRLSREGARRYATVQLRASRGTVIAYLFCVGMLMIVLDATIVNVACRRTRRTWASRRATSRGVSTRI
jgi:hypothetical protein